MLRGHSSEHLETYALRSKANIKGPAQGSLPFTNWPGQGSLRFSPAHSPGGRLTNVSLRVDLPFDPSTSSGRTESKSSGRTDLAGSGRTKQARVRSCQVLREACCAKPAARSLLSPGGRLTNASLRVDLPFDPSTGSGQAGSGRTKQAIIRTCQVLRKACCAKPLPVLSNSTSSAQACRSVEARLGSSSRIMRHPLPGECTDRGHR